MYTYLEDITQVKTRYNIPYNLIGRIQDITHINNNYPDYYKFTLYNNHSNSKDYTCICKPNLLQNKKLTNNDSIVIEYVPVKNFLDIGDVLLIRSITHPVLGLTGDKSKDVTILMKEIKKIIESQFKNNTFNQTHHQQLNRAYIEFNRAYTNCHKKVKWWKQ